MENSSLCVFPYSVHKCSISSDSYPEPVPPPREWNIINPCRLEQFSTWRLTLFTSLHRLSWRSSYSGWAGLQDTYIQCRPEPSMRGIWAESPSQTRRTLFRGWLRLPSYLSNCIEAPCKVVCSVFVARNHLFRTVQWLVRTIADFIWNVSTSDLFW